MTARTLGIFVGGASSRMGGRPKGLLPAPGSGEPLVVRLVRIGREAGLSPLLVGRAEAYRSALPGLAVLEDDPERAGPLAGLSALLRHAGDGAVVALACDMPFIGAELLFRLATDPSRAAILAPRAEDDAPWEPFLARYDPPRVLPKLGDAVHSFQALFARVEVARFALAPSERRALRDWDEPGDLRR